MADDKNAPSQSAHIERAEIKKTTEAVKDSARDIRRSAGKIEGSADRSTQLAADRTVLAAERTYAAWVRTGLAALASGVGASALLKDILPGLMIQFASTILILFSAFCFCAAVWRELVPKMQNPVSEIPRIPRTILFVVNGSLTVVALCAIISIWLARLDPFREVCAVGLRDAGMVASPIQIPGVKYEKTQTLTINLDPKAVLR